jgi:hypothetical protein
MPLQNTDDDKLNPGQANYNAKVNNVGKREQAGTFDTISKNYDKTADSTQENKNIAKAKALENTPSANWTNKVVGGMASASGVKTKKSNNPLIAILIIIFGGGATFAGLFGAMSLLPLDLVSKFVDKENAQNTSFTIRTDRIINSKISKQITSGFCSPSKPLLCKYEKPSNKLLNALEKEGVTAFKGDTQVKGTGLFPNDRPDHFVFKGNKIAAKDFANKLSGDAEFRAAFHNAYTPRFIGFADNIFKAIKARFNFTTTDKLKSAKTADEANKTLSETSKGPENGSNAAKGAAADVEEAFIEKEIIAAETKAAENVGKAGKGNLIGLIAGVVCGAGDIPGLIISVVRGYQMLQLIDYAATVLSTVGAWKAGDAQPAEISSLGSLLTATVDGKSALDSFGVKNILYGDTQTTDTTWQQYSPGASVIGALGSISQFTSGTTKKDVCAVATNPATGAAIDAATSETVVVPLLQLGVGFIVGTAIEKLAGPIIGAAMNLIPKNFFQPLITFFLGDLTQGKTGIAVGNILSSGIVHLLGQTANKGGNMPLTVKQKLAYDNTTAQVNLAYAKEDRATHSPFDASNPNTLLGSFVSNLLPYYGNMGSVAGVFSSLGSIITGSIGTIIGQPAARAASADGSQYTLCQDPSISSPSSGDQIAAGPFCNIQYGIPPEYLSIDPEVVANTLIASGDIDPTTGDVKDNSNSGISLPDPTKSSDQQAAGSLSSWMTLCTDGTTTNASSCQLTADNVKNNPQIVNYALYTIDHRVQTTMDGEDATLDPQKSTTVQSAVIPITNPTPNLATTIITAINANSAKATKISLTSTSNFSAVLLNNNVTNNKPTHSFIPSNPLAYIVVPKKSVGITI